MQLLISSFLGFMLGIISTFVIQKINELRKLSLAITALAFEIADNQDKIDLLREIDLEKSVEENEIFTGPSDDIYKHVKDELQLLPPHILQYITRYYELVAKHKPKWEENLKKQSYRETDVVNFLNTLENLSVDIMLHRFKPVIEARNPWSKYYYLRKLLLSPTWLRKGKQYLDWQRYERLEEEVILGKNKRESWESFVAKYRKSSTHIEE